MVFGFDLNANVSFFFNHHVFPRTFARYNFWWGNDIALYVVLPSKCEEDKPKKKLQKMGMHCWALNDMFSPLRETSYSSLCCVGSVAYGYGSFLIKRVNMEIKQPRPC
ncbi:LOW QUALITY PROTEIN: hypothetical protein PanWU01x14_195480 [Parasponia andersonii]|uniref:Uncharacterized protein n=1 Tax=Parasponia andersonii TaxID=3476 RepID=A0A2P5BZY6_PARAD|nr:LOW QUALITY PROTEIN: hypothetical protein PanWU01x14_195480 [Parasponia andersonii]